MNIKVKKEDIFDYVVGNTSYDAIEKIIDPTQYEIFDCGIYNHKTKKMIAQDDSYVEYCAQVTRLRSLAKTMSYQEIIKICEELAEIAPVEISI